MIRMYTAEVITTESAVQVSRRLTEESKMFTVTPLPEDVFEFAVKEENKSFLDELIIQYSELDTYFQRNYALGILDHVADIVHSRIDDVDVGMRSVIKTMVEMDPKSLYASYIAPGVDQVINLVSESLDLSDEDEEEGDSDVPS